MLRVFRSDWKFILKRWETYFAAAAAKSLQSCPTLCDPIDGNLPGSPVPGILQARTLEWVAISFSNAWKWKVKVKPLSRVRPSATPWTAAFQAPLSMDFPGKSTGVGCHCLLRSSSNTCIFSVKHSTAFVHLETLDGISVWHLRTISNSKITNANHKNVKTQH